MTVSMLVSEIQSKRRKLENVRIMSVMGSKLHHGGETAEMVDRERYRVLEVRPGEEFPLHIQNQKLKTEDNVKLPHRGWLPQDEWVFLLWGDSYV